MHRTTIARGAGALATGVLTLAAAASGQTTVAGAAAVRDFRLDAGHSAVDFSIPFLHSRVRGSFDQVRGTLLLDERTLTNSSVTIAIATKSIRTGSAHRDEHLRSADFLDAERYPAITFESRAVERTRGGYVLRGALTMHGVTREVAIPFRMTHPVDHDPHGSALAGFEGTLLLARKDFGILGGSKFNDWFDQLRSATMGDTVEITLATEWWDTDFDRVRDASLETSVASIDRDGVAAVVARARARRAQDSTAFRNGEWQIDQIGRALLARGRAADAVEIFKLNAELFPNSSAAHASLARGYELAGDRAAAVAGYDRALALDPQDTRAAELRRRMRE